MVEILQGKKQKEAALHPSRLDVLREYNARDALSEKHKEDLRRLEAGYQGEQLVLDYLNEYGESHWKVARNLWLETNPIFECDLLLITGIVWYPIEIKHYTGQYTLENSQWSCYGAKHPNNPVQQSQKVCIHFQNLVREHKIPVNVKGRLVFTGSHFDLNIIDQVGDVEIVTLNQLRDHIRDIAWKEKNTYSKDIDVERILKFIETYETDNPFPAEDLYEELGSKLRKGVRCCHCGSFDVNLKNSYVSCKCGMHEPREMAIVRTICEYGLLHFNTDLMTHEVVDFFGGDFSMPTIRKYLNQYFERYGKGSAIKYRNLKLPFEKIYKLFHFKRERYFIAPVKCALR